MTKLLFYFFKARVVLTAIPLIVALFINWHAYHNALVTILVGGVLFLIGLTFRIWAQQHIHYRLKNDWVLTTTGPYALMRNPIYVGSTLICTGLTIGTEVLWMAPISFIVCCLVYSLVVRYEEGWLKEKFGEAYLEYMRQVPRWFPRPGNFPKLQWCNECLPASLMAEGYNLLFIVPLVLKRILI
ncbi:MAG: methyltransferase family protein [Armatimonadota bacterium]